MKHKSSIHLCQVLFGVDKALAYEWISSNLDATFQQSYILVGNEKGALYNELISQGREVFFIRSTSGKWGYVKLMIQLTVRFLKLKPDVVHGHLFPASMCSMFAAWLTRVPKRIYTRHHSTYNHLYYPQSVKLDQITNRFATHIVAISKNVHNVLVEIEGIKEDKIVDIPHGFDLSLFDSPSRRIVETLKQKYNSEGKAPVIGVIARMTYWKGHTYIIKAFKRLLDQYPDALLILANARGPAAEAIQAELTAELPQHSYQTIRFEPEIGALYKLFDVYVHTPINPQIEAFGMTYVEALAAGVPCVFTLSGIAHEIITHEQQALVVPYENSLAIYESLLRILEDEVLCDDLIKRGRERVIQPFGLDIYIKRLEALYASDRRQKTNSADVHHK